MSSSSRICIICIWAASTPAIPGHRLGPWVPCWAVFRSLRAQQDWVTASFSILKAGRPSRNRSGNRKPVWHFALCCHAMLYNLYILITTLIFHEFLGFYLAHPGCLVISSRFWSFRQLWCLISSSRRSISTPEAPLDSVQASNALDDLWTKHVALRCIWFTLMHWYNIYIIFIYLVYI